jgi:hypothetical protein
MSVIILWANTALPAPMSATFSFVSFLELEKVYELLKGIIAETSSLALNAVVHVQ